MLSQPDSGLLDAGLIIFDKDALFRSSQCLIIIIASLLVVIRAKCVSSGATRYSVRLLTRERFPTKLVRRVDSATLSYTRLKNVFIYSMYK